MFCLDPVNPRFATKRAIRIEPKNMGPGLIVNPPLIRDTSPETWRLLRIAGNAPARRLPDALITAIHQSLGTSSTEGFINPPDSSPASWKIIKAQKNRLASRVIVKW
jgi:hypothetical protein